MRVANTKNNLQLLRALFSSSSSKRHTTHSIYCVAAVLVAAAALLLLLQANIAEAAVVQCFQASPGVATHARSRTRAAATMGMPLSSGYTITAMMLPWNGGDQTAAESEAASVLGVAADSVSRDDDDAAPKKTIMTGLYVHIPYCRRRCRYCNFAIVPIGNHHQIHHAEADDDSTATSDGNDADGSLAVAEAAQARGFRAMDQTYADALLQELSLLQKRGDDDGTSIIGEETINSETQTRKRKRRIPLRSIYFGGGTPSLAPIETLRRIMSAILDHDRSPFAVPVVNTDNNSIAMTDTDTDRCEITIELDPGTFTLEKLQALKEIGFNRLSLGVQSFDDRVLESLGRVHRSKDIFESIAMIQSVYGDQANYSLDLISGLPGLSLGFWIETLATAVQLKPRPVHLSIYDLQVERGTVFGKWYDKQDDDDDGSVATTTTTTTTTLFQLTQGEAPVTREILRLPSSRDAAFMYKYAAGYLRAKGYEHYEVSSYAFLKPAAAASSPSNGESRASKGGGGGGRDSHRSRHNQIYWALEKDSQWFAIGLGATSFVDGRIVARPRTLFDYQRWVEDQAAPAAVEESSSSSSLHDNNSSSSSSKRLPEPVSDLDLLTDAVLKRLRTSEGLSLDWVQQRFGDAFMKAVLRGSQLGIDLGLARLDRTSNTLRLVDPDGFLYSNSIISSIFVELEGV